MHLVYPPDGHQTFEKSTFFIGAVAPGETVSINRYPIPVSRQGFFAVKVDLQPGENAYPFHVEGPNTKSADFEHRIYLRVPDNYSGGDEYFVQELVKPYKKYGVMAGDDIVLTCPGPPDAPDTEVTCSIPDLNIELFPMRPASTWPDNRQGVFGQLHQTRLPWPVSQLYVGHVQTLPNQAEKNDITVHYECFSSKENVQFVALGGLSVLPRHPLQYVRVVADAAISRTGPADTAARRTPLLKGTCLNVVGFEDDYLKIRYSQFDVAWIREDAVEAASQQLYPFFVPIWLIQAQTDAVGFIVTFNLSRLIPMDVLADENTVVLTLYQAVSHCDFIHMPSNTFENGLAGITWSQPQPDVMVIRIELASPLLGIERQYNPQTHVFSCQVKTVEALPVNRFVVAIDAGHGGSEPGATAPDGTPEKDLNLTMAKKLFAVLQNSYGIQPVLIRQNDETLTLEERLDLTQKANANLLIALHHNALPDGREPMAEHGVCSLYYHPFAMSWAKAFQQQLSSQTRFADYGLMYDSLYICRSFAQPAVLLELGFLTHPEDAEKILDANHQDIVVQAIRMAIEQQVETLQRNIKQTLSGTAVVDDFNF